MSSELMRVAKTAPEAVLAFKGLFAEAVREHFESPWLYMYLLEDCMMELCYWNTNMPAQDKIDAADLMFDEFKVKIMEILKLYWSEEDSEKAIELRKSFNAAATKHLQLMAKEGRRNSQNDQGTIQKIHDMSCKLGAGCSEEEKQTTVENETVTEKSTEPAVEKAVEMVEATKVLTETSELLTAATKEAADLTVKVTELEAQVKSFEEKNRELGETNKSLELEMKKWKASALTAKAMLTNHLNTPAPRPGHASQS